MTKANVPWLMGYILAFIVVVVVVRGQYDTDIPKQSEIQKCMLLDRKRKLKGYEQDAKEERKEAVCKPSFNLTIDCIIKYSLMSNHPLDTLMRNSTSMARWKEANKYLCNQYRRINEKNKPCAKSSMECMKIFDWHIYTWCVPDTRCYYDRIHNCSESVAIAWAKYVLLAKSNVCIVSDQYFQLYPLYGPELKCYPNTQVDVHATLDWVYRGFCTRYHYHRTTECIRDEIGMLSSGDLDDNKSHYLHKALRFARDRHILCVYLNKLPAKTCNVIQEDITEICLKNLYYSHWRKEVPLSESVEIYASCIYKQYKHCDLNLARLLRDNIRSYNIDKMFTHGNSHLPTASTWIIWGLQVAYIYLMIFLTVSI